MYLHYTDLNLKENRTKTGDFFDEFREKNFKSRKYNHREKQKNGISYGQCLSKYICIRSKTSIIPYN